MPHPYQSQDPHPAPPHAQPGVGGEGLQPHRTALLEPVPGEELGGENSDPSDPSSQAGGGAGAEHGGGGGEAGPGGGGGEGQHQQVHHHRPGQEAGRGEGGGAGRAVNEPSRSFTVPQT